MSQYKTRSVCPDCNSHEHGTATRQPYYCRYCGAALMKTKYVQTGCTEVVISGDIITVRSRDDRYDGFRFAADAQTTCDTVACALAEFVAMRDKREERAARNAERIRRQQDLEDLLDD